MAVSHQQATSSTMVIATLVVVICALTGAADAWCKSGFKDCDYNPQNGCETCIKTDVNNCGNCGVKCPTYPYSTPTCSNYKCGYMCSPGWKDCDYNSQNGCETDVGKDIYNCGSCGYKCPTYPYTTTTCYNGQCKSVCKPGWKDCNNNMQDGCETDVGKDMSNCGSCGYKCPTYPYTTTTCYNGQCKSVCKPGWKDCNNNMQDGCETDVGKDMNNCGSCGYKCPTYPYTTTTCSSGVCNSVCTPGWKDCDGKKENGCETDVGKDVKNCGGCGLTCPTYPYSIPTCSGGYCGYTCTSGWMDCDGKKENGCETDVGKDVYNCGGCGKKCPCTDPNALPTCSNGVCGVQCKGGYTYDSYQKKCV